jgi:hypothetical protein
MERGHPCPQKLARGKLIFLAIRIYIKTFGRERPLRAGCPRSINSLQETRPASFFVQIFTGGDLL